MKDFPDFFFKNLNTMYISPTIMGFSDYERTKMRNVFCLMTITLLMASFSSVGIIQNNGANAASNFIFKEKFRDSFAIADKTTTEGSITTELSAQASKDLSGNIVVSVFLTRFDESTGTLLTEFFGEGSGQLTIGAGLSSATFSGTITGTDFATGEDKTVTVNSQLSATGKVRTTTFGSHESSRDLTLVFQTQAKLRPASGSVTISGDLTFSTDGATGIIGNANQGSLIVQKN